MPPGTQKSALYVDTGGLASASRTVHVINGSRVESGAMGVTFRKNYVATLAGIDTTSGAGADGRVCACARVNTTTLIFEPEYIFGVSGSDLKLMSDYLVSDVSKLPYTKPTEAYPTRELPAIGIYYIDCPGNTATFSQNFPLNTSGILFINGNLRIESHSLGAFFTGVIYVNNGSVRIDGPAFFTGTVICNNKNLQHITLEGNTGLVEIDYDNDIISYVTQQLTQYRENKAMYRVQSVLK